MALSVLRDLWTEEAPAGGTHSSRWDTVVVALLCVAGLLDGLVSNDVAWPGLSVPLMTALPVLLYWRHRRPLLVVSAVAATYAALHGAMLLAGVGGTIVNPWVLGVLAYFLARRASGRDAILGIGILAIGTAIAGATGVLRSVEGAIGLPVFLILFVLVGIAARLWSGRGAARLSEARLSERNRIARELHDTVAHHVSAIAVQAQGGQEILFTDPNAAAGAFAVIEEEASRTLAEMRLILGVLRREGPAELAPQPGIADILRLTDTGIPGPPVTVAILGEVGNLSVPVASGLFRLTQEAVTNARRHARRATHISVEIDGRDDEIVLTVSDDGEPRAHAGPGFGLLGMSERATLFGGAFNAGPAPGGGWTIRASLPRKGEPT